MMAERASRPTSASLPLAAAASPPMPDELLQLAGGGEHIEALRSWGYRIGLAVRDALDASGRIEHAVGDRGQHVDAISNHFGLSSKHHCLNAEPLGWLRLSETQATKGLQHFLARDDRRIRLFLQAVAPTVAWPPDMTALDIAAETPSGRGRIDLLVTGEAQGRIWGAVVEAKFEHSLKGNPLGEYLRHGAKLKMALDPASKAERTGALIVLGKKFSRQTKKKMARHSKWRFVHWYEVLRRFDACLNEPTIDEDFRRFRRTLWERAGSAR